MSCYRSMPFLLLGILAAFSTWGENVISGQDLLGCWRAEDARDAKLPDSIDRSQEAVLHDITVMRPGEDVVDHPALFLDGKAGYIEIPARDVFNPNALTLAVWFKAEPGAITDQVPLLVKSLPTHVEPWYQYGLFVMDTPEHPQALSCYVSVGGKTRFLEAPATPLYAGWIHIAATYDGSVLRLYRNGQPVAEQAGPTAPLDAFDTPILLGAYANLPKKTSSLFCGYIASVRMYGQALDASRINALYTSERPAFPETQELIRDTSPYAQHLNEALAQGRDVWGENLISQGGATYDGIKDLLRPLFYSTGDTNEVLGVHNLLFGTDGGEPPYIIPVADGSRISADVYQSDRRVECFTGINGDEPYGRDVARLEGPSLEADWHPVLVTGYTDAAGTHYAQETCAGWLPGISSLAAFIKLSINRPADEKGSPGVVYRCSPAEPANMASSEGASWTDRGLVCPAPTSFDSPSVYYIVWSPNAPVPAGYRMDAAAYTAAKTAWVGYWESALSRGRLFEAPEPRVMNVQRNLLIQNLIMRWRYSLGAVVYHNSYFQPESSDSLSCLGMYGFLDECRDGLGAIVTLSKGEAYYSNWERGEKLSHGAHYYYLTRDAAFIDQYTPVYTQIAAALKQQIEKDPNGLLLKQRHCGDIPTVGYCTFHQAVCWRGLRDMAEVWGQTGHADLSQEYGALAARFRASLQRAIDASAKTLPDGSLFVPSLLLDEKTVYDPITETRMGSYWNLCMPYAFASGLWDPNGTDLRRITDFMHQHGGLLLGLLRFNYYPVPIGAWRTSGLPGYYTTGFDNVYLPSYLRMVSDLDDPERLILSFYGKLAHGQTRGTYVSGEGETVGTRPPEFYRSCYGTPCSANNSVFLLALRLMLIREAFDNATGRPSALYLAPATPREWLKSGNHIRANNAPTCLGPVSFDIHSRLDENRVCAQIQLPQAWSTETPVSLRLRVPENRSMVAVNVNGHSWKDFEPVGETISLKGLTGTITLEAQYNK